MGFLGPIPADKLAASYNVHTQTLTLSAEGEARNYTTGIQFERQSWLGGYKFNLEGWTGPLADPESYEHYTHEQAFQLQMPSRVAPSGSVIIATANHPSGVAVPVRFLGGFIPPAENEATEKATTAPAQAAAGAAPAAAPVEAPHAAPQLMQPDNQKINVLFKMPFNIQEGDRVPTGGTVTMKFDPSVLTLEKAGIQGTNIVWTLNSLKTGNTQVIVTVTGGIAQYVIQKIYDVRIFVLD
ncbi:hypothetical protein [Hymenobacter lucidus]|uniref:Uncharacterized protein n=1 Tax=Hymenobacter lucidus TaxID=2880930 RepID=A0ABS8ATY8_9BACT|nr:hypothetical protein [Hymenobacter lucidus]MCB2409695.1 hypothetical protein [Hymenobacter lucidus]